MTNRLFQPTLGAWPVDEGFHFRVWCPKAESVELIFEKTGQPPSTRHLVSNDAGYWGLAVPDAQAGDSYRYLIDGKGPFPDPASRFQPQGVHGSSQLVDPSSFVWSDQHWHAPPFANWVIYELHVGTFSAEGTYEGARRKVPYLKDLGINAVEIMPLADFAGNRNWGYDGVCLYAPSRAYGTPDDLRRFVDECHRAGIAVIFDVVYNHLGPRGNYLNGFSPYYFDTQHSTPWGPAMNLKGDHHEDVRHFLIENSLYWIHEYHIDGLRFDATQALLDDELLSQLRHHIRDCAPRPVAMIAEDDRNHHLLVKETSQGGHGLEGVWSDDFCRISRRLTTKDQAGLMTDYPDSVDALADTIRRGWYYTGQIAPSSKTARGSDPEGIHHSRFVVYLQNHDQVGNLPYGERLHAVIPWSAYRALSTLLLTVPETPLLFMGQEWATRAPFHFFTDHEKDLGRMIAESRRSEFQRQRYTLDHPLPQPQSKDAFEKSRLDWFELQANPNGQMHRFFKKLLEWRKIEGLYAREGAEFSIRSQDDSVLILSYVKEGKGIWIVVNVRPRSVAALLPDIDPASVELLFSSEDPRFTRETMPVFLSLKKDPPEARFEREAAIIFRAKSKVT